MGFYDFYNFYSHVYRSGGSREVKAVQTSKNTLYSKKAVIVAAGCWSGSLIHDLFRDSDIVLDVPVKPRKVRTRMSTGYSSKVFLFLFLYKILDFVIHWSKRIQICDYKDVELVWEAYVEPQLHASSSNFRKCSFPSLLPLFYSKKKDMGYLLLGVAVGKNAAVLWHYSQALIGSIAVVNLLIC